MLALLLRQLYKHFKKMKQENPSMDSKEFGKKVVQNAITRFKNGQKQEDNLLTEGKNMGDFEGFFDEMGRVFGKSSGSKRTGKGRHDGISQRRKDGSTKNKNELLRDAGLEDAERFDATNLFQSANKMRKWYKRIGVETAMGMDAAVRTILTTATGSPSAQAQTDFEIQGIRIQHNGDGASAAATIAIHETLLAHMAFTQIKVGDDNMLTTSNMVGAYVFSDRETEGGDLAGYVATTTQQVSMSIVNNAAYSALIITSVVGEVVAEWAGK